MATEGAPVAFGKRQPLNHPLPTGALSNSSPTVQTTGFRTICTSIEPAYPSEDSRFIDFNTLVARPIGKHDDWQRYATSHAGNDKAILDFIFVSTNPSPQARLLMRAVER
jgi:hypothetical protein